MDPVVRVLHPAPIVNSCEPIFQCMDCAVSCCQLGDAAVSPPLASVDWLCFMHRMVAMAGR